MLPLTCWGGGSEGPRDCAEETPVPRIAICGTRPGRERAQTGILLLACSQHVNPVSDETPEKS